MNNLRIQLLILFHFLLPLVVFSQEVETVTQTGHFAAITAVSVSSDSRLIVTGSADKTIKLWRAADGKEIRTFTGNRDDITFLSFSRNNKSILSISEIGIAILWEVNTGKVLHIFSMDDDGITCAAFHPVLPQIVFGTKKNGVSIWDLNTFQKIGEFKAIPENLRYQQNFEYSEIKTVSFNINGTQLIAGVADRTAIIWDIKNRKELIKIKKPNSFCSSCLTSAIFVNGSALIVRDDSMLTFDALSGKKLLNFDDVESTVESVTVCEASNSVAGIEYGEVKIWDFKTGKLKRKMGNKSEKRIRSLALSNNGQWLVTGNEYRTADIWDVKTGKIVLTLIGYLNEIDESFLNKSEMFWAAFISDAKLSPDGKYIAVGRSGNNVKLIDFKTGNIQTLKGHKNRVIAINFSNDGKYLVSGGMDGKAIVWDVATGKMINEFNYTDNNLAIFSVDMSSDNKLVATADWAGYIVIWNRETGKIEKSIYPHGGAASYHVKFAPNNLYIISAGLDRKLKLLEIDTGDEIREFKGHTNLVNSININPQGDKIITSSWDGTFRVWDFLSGLQTLKVKAHPEGVYTAKFDATVKYIVTGGEDNLIKMWDASSGNLIASYEGHKGGVGDVSLSPDTKYLVSGSRDGTVGIWDVAAKTQLLSMVFLNENDWFIRNPQGYFDATNGAFQSISFVNGTEIFSLNQFFNEFYHPGLFKQVMGNETTVFRQNVNQTITNYPPPGVEFVSPVQNTSTDNSIVTCIIKVTNNGGGIRELKIMQNGKRIAVDDADLKRVKKDGQYVMKTFDINLVPGDNEISVSAVNDGEIESEPVTTHMVYKGLQKTSNCYVLSIGINKYENENLNLTFAMPDARSFAEVIEHKAQKLFNKIEMFTLYDKQATRENILSTFETIKKTMKKEDVFVLFYAGHGSLNESKFYFITTENTGLYQKDKLDKAISAEELQGKLKELQALKQVLFIDACHSGSSVDMLAMRGAEEEKALAQLSRSSGIHVMASSESQQQSAEIKSLGHGVFTYVLLEALNGKADGAPMDSKITVYEIKSFIDDQVPELSFKLIQHKQFPSTFSIGHDFPLVIE